MSSPATVPSEGDPRDSPVSMSGSLSDSPAPNEGQACYLCGAKYKSPKILSCLHVFCQPCLEENLTGEEEREHREGHITCPQCQQETPLPGKGVCDLPSDLVMVNMLDMTAVQERQIICTSCKAREKAVARCADCATFLCPNCVTAHQYMRCFDNHKVVSFEDLSADENLALHKPIFCSSHPKEFMNFFCTSCQVPVCNECIVRGAHAQGDHMTERINDAESKVKDELKVLITESKSKLQFCEEATTTLQNNLTEIQMHRDDAKSLIQETFQSYKAILEKRQEEILAELEELHATQELSIMESIHHVDQTMSRIEDGCLFTERILEKGSGVEILLMKKMIYTQLLSLISNTPKAELAAKLEFHTDTKLFEEAVKETYGSFKKEEPPAPASSSHSEPTSTIQSPLQSSFENEGFSLPSGMLRDDDHEPSSLSPLGTNDFAQHLQNIPMALNMPVNHPSPPNLTSMPPPIGGTPITGMTEAVRSYSRNSHSPAMSDSGVSLDASSGGSGSNTPQVNLATLAKMGNLSINNQGEYPREELYGESTHDFFSYMHRHISLNGQLLPGFNINTMPQLTHMISKPPPPPTSVPNSISGHGDGMNSPLASHLDSLVSSTDNLHIAPNLNLDNLTGAGASLVSSSSMVPASVQPPTLDTLASLLHQQAAAAGATSASGSQINTFMPTGSSSGSLTPTSGMFNSVHSPRGSVMGSTSGMGSMGSMLGSNGGTAGLDAFAATDGQNGGQNPPFPRRSGKVSAMQIRCKFGQLGPGKGQFNSPHGFCMGLDEDIIVADTNNHRIQIFEKTGEFKYQFGIPGREEGQLWYPRKVAVMRNSGKFVVCDRGNERSRMQIFTKNGHFIKKIAIRYIDIVAGLAITPQGHIVAVDSVSPTVFCIAESGDLIRWFDCSDYMREPSDIAIAGKEYFVCDFKGHCVVVFSEEGQFLRRIGCENITNFPNGIDISDAGDVLVGDSHGNRFHVAVFQRDGSLIGEFECPYVKVSRCCGLNITSEGYIVTLAKNNHHVLVLNTLYIT